MVVVEGRSGGSVEDDLPAGFSELKKTTVVQRSPMRCRYAGEATRWRHALAGAGLLALFLLLLSSRTEHQSAGEWSQRAKDVGTTPITPRRGRAPQLLL